MDKRWIRIFWGIILILAGAWTLANSLGFVEQPPLMIWIAIFGILSAFFFASYFVSGIRNWGWLFPALITGALALTIYLGATKRADKSIASLILGSIALPFLVAFFVDKVKNWWALIPAWVLLVIIGIIEISDNSAGELIATLILFAIALPFAVVFLVDHQRKWALIPAVVLAVIGTIPLIDYLSSGEWIATFVLIVIAIPFLVIFLKDRSRKWALIPAIALIVLGLIPAMTKEVSDEWIGALVTMVIALPFLIAYFIFPNAWWVLIPAGIMGSIAVVMGLVAILGGNPTPTNGGIIGGALFLGWALTFGILWLRRTQAPTEWAKYPAIGLGLFGLSIMVFRERMNEFWPVFIIAAGLLMLYFSWREQRTA